MPQVSKVLLDKSSQEKLLSHLDLVLGKLSRNEMSLFIPSFLTKTEKLMLAKRLAIGIMLKSGYTQTEISQALKVTRVTVSRMELQLKINGEGYNLALTKLKEEEALEEFKKFLTSLARYSIKAAGGRI